MTRSYGVIGCGGVGVQKHIPAVQNNPRAELTAVCDIDEAAAEEASPPGVEHFTDVGAVCERADAVSVTVPPNVHYDVLETVVEHDVDVLCEKPFTPTEAEASDILHRTDNLVSEVNNTLFKPVVRRAVRRLPSIGEPEIVLVQKTKRDPEGFVENWGQWLDDIRAGHFGEILPHWIYQCREFLGDIDEVTDVTISDSEGTPVAPDDVVAMVRSGTREGRIGVSFRASGPDAIFVVAENGIMTVNFEHRLVTVGKHPTSPIDVLKDNVITGVDTLYQTVGRSATFAADAVTRKFEVVPDFAYRNHGHYQQVDEVVREGPLTVDRSDILNNAMVYEEITGAIEDWQ